MPSQQLDRAVVIGGSVAGLAAARALSERAADVVVLEARSLPGDDLPSSIVPQGEFPHVLLAGGALALERCVPGLLDDLFAHGAVGSADAGRRGHWWAAGAVRTELGRLDVDVPMCSRALVETRLRAAVRARPNVTLLDGTVVRGLRADRGRVTGVEIGVGPAREILDAALVVDASGRGSRTPTWLRAAGVAEPPVTRVEVGITYTAVDVRRHATDVGGGLFAVVQNTPELARIGAALPAEGDRWRIVLGGYFGDAAPTTRDGVLAFAASLPDPAVLRLLENEWVGEPRRYRFPSSQRRHFERARHLPAGFCAVGDSVASFNPLYGQGMSAAALQVEALVRCLDRHGTSARFARAVARATATVVANPWRIATGADFVYPGTIGKRPPGTDLVNRYLARVMVAAASDQAVNDAFTAVQNLVAAPQALFAPGIVRRVRRAGRRTVTVPALEPAM